MADTVLLTGAAGLIGGAVATRLRSAGVNSIGIDRSSGSVDGNQVIECDIRDVHKLSALANEHQFTAIIHCGAYSGPFLGGDNPAAVVAVNVGGTANLLEVARVHKLRRFVFCSSVSAAGPTSARTDETLLLKPSSIYGATKAACEHLVTTYGQVFGFETVCLRFSAVWGPQRSMPCALGSMIKDAVNRKPTRLSEGGDFPTQYVHVDDAAEAIFSALTTTRLTQPTYFITGGETITLAEVANRVGAIVPSADIKIGPGGDSTFDWQEEFDISAAHRDLGFTPRVGLDEGIEAFVRSMTARR